MFLHWDIWSTRIIQARRDRSCLWSDSNLKQCSCLEIFDQQDNPNLILLVLISYHIIWYQSFRFKIGYMFPLRFFSIWFLFIFIFLVFNRPKVQNSIFALLKILRGENESFICVNECKKSGLKFLECIHMRDCCEGLCIFISYVLQQSFRNGWEWL